MRTVLSKCHISSPYSGEFDVYKYIEYWNVPKSNIELIHRYETYEEYDHLVTALKVKNIRLEDITEFKGINKEELEKEVKRNESVFR